MRLSRSKWLVGSLLAAVLFVPAWGTTTDAHTAMPGTLNYVEGTADLGSQALGSQSVGTAELQPGETLDTGNGKAEVLLTPGVFLRLGSDSSVRMISPDLTNTEVALSKGQAMVEVDEIYKQNDIRVKVDGTPARIEKTGLYDFDANQNEVRVLDGQAMVQEGDKDIKIKGGHELSVAPGAPQKTDKFDKKAFEDSELYRWSSLRSAYLADANAQQAQVYFADGWYGPGWWGAGWYWDPWFAAYTFIPGDGIFYSPFGWGFYSPLWAYRAPVVNGHYVHNFTTYRPHYATGPNYAHGIYRGPGSTGAFHSGAVRPGEGAMAHSFGAVGGFHGGAGSFHGAVGSFGGRR